MWFSILVLDDIVILNQPPGNYLYQTNAKEKSSMFRIFIINSSPPSAAYMRWWSGSPLIQIRACRLDGTKPSSEPVLAYCQLDPN